MKSIEKLKDIKNILSIDRDIYIWDVMLFLEKNNLYEFIHWYYFDFSKNIYKHNTEFNLIQMRVNKSDHLENQSKHCIWFVYEILTWEFAFIKYCCLHQFIFKYS